MNIALCIAVTALMLSPALAVTPLASRGYAVLPQPHDVQLEGSDFAFGSDWSLEIAPGIRTDDSAVEALRQDLKDRFGIVFSERSARVIRLEIRPGSVPVGASLDRDKAALAKQAFHIDLDPQKIDMLANAPAGLFYAVGTLVQLVRPHGSGFELPAGRIVDWPDLQLRQIYWDDAHHLDRLPVLKAALRQAAFYKINGFVLKLEGHFQFKSAPAVVEPYALSPGELQELTDYGLRYHVQLIPYLDGPAHIAFILKHPEYASFRQFATSNYESCSTNEAATNLLLGMFHDLLDANKGVDYVYLSTDEAYYIGLADTPQCREKAAGTPSQLLASFVDRIAGDLRKRGRTTMFWGEYPLKPDQIASLPQDLISGETAPQFDPAFAKHGIRQLIYTSTQGEEDFFPQYFSPPQTARLHGRPFSHPRVEENMQAIASGPSRQDALLMGMINAGWADRGLHPETFWLGYATAAAAGWNPDPADPAEASEAFYTQFYGPRHLRMSRVYQLMSLQAQIWTDTWESVPSSARKPIWGNSAKIFTPPVPAKDQTIPVPLPVSDKETHRFHVASEAMAGNDELMGLLHENLRRVSRNRYNLHVFLSIAEILRQNLELLIGLHEISSDVRAADTVAKYDRALDRLTDLRDRRNRVLRSTEKTWEESWFPRVNAANGRVFLHQADDVKDHLPDRTVGMEYLIYRDLQLPVNAWVSAMEAERNRLAVRDKEPIRNRAFDWADLQGANGPR